MYVIFQMNAVITRVSMVVVVMLEYAHVLPGIQETFVKQVKFYVTSYILFSYTWVHDSQAEEFGAWGIQSEWLRICTHIKNDPFLHITVSIKQKRISFPTVSIALNLIKGRQN